MPLAHAVPCQSRCPQLTPSLYSSWAEPSAYCHRTDNSLSHPYRPRLTQSALSAFHFSCSHSPLHIGAYLCDVDIELSASNPMQLPCSVYLPHTFLLCHLYGEGNGLLSLTFIHALSLSELHHGHAQCGVILHHWFRTADDTSPSSRSGSITPYHRDSRSSVCFLPCTALTANRNLQSWSSLLRKQPPIPCFSLRTAFAAFSAFPPSCHNKQE